MVPALIVSRSTTCPLLYVDSWALEAAAGGRTTWHSSTRWSAARWSSCDRRYAHRQKHQRCAPIAVLPQQARRCLFTSTHPFPAVPLQMEARVGGLCALLQQAATRLCPAASAAATDAALSLLSGLQAARLRLQPDAPRTAAASLECCIQQLLRVLHQGLEPLTPAPAPVAAPPPRPAADCFRAAGDTAQHTTQLAALVKGLGFDAADWKVAQAGLAQRTAQALQSQRLSTTELAAVAAAAATEQASPQELEAILLAAAAIPAWQEGSSQPSALHDAVAEVLWVMRQFRPPAELPPDQRPHLSAEGWAAYWLLEPRVRAWLLC